ncbi:hypothetical protein LPJ61_006126, partial [Coemansia biformis]
HRRSFDIAMLQLHPHPHPLPAPGSYQPSHQTHPPLPPLQIQHAPFFPPLRHPMNDSGLGVVGLSRPASIRPQSGHSVQSLSSNQSFAETASDGFVVSSPTHETAAASSAGISDIALLLSGALQVKRNTSGKPPYPYATLITYAILQDPRKQMTLSEIYAWLMDYYPYFKTAGSGWKNSIRHNLSLNKLFMRIPRPINEPGKGAYWSVDLVELNDAVNSRSRQPTHRYSPPRKGRPVSAGSHSAARIMPPPPLSIGAPRHSLHDQMPNPFLAGVTSSVSEMGILAAAPEGGEYASRRSSLQMPAAHRYQPYALHSHAGLGAIGSYQSVSQLQPMVPPAYGSSALPLMAPMASPQGRGGPLERPAVQPPAQSAAPLLAQPGPAALPPSAAPAFPHPGRERSGSLGYSARTPTADASSRMAALSLRRQLQVRTSPSLPDGILTSPREALYADAMAPPRGPAAGDQQAAFDRAMGPALLAPASRSRAQVPAAPGADGRAPEGEGATSLGDLSAYIAYISAQHPPSA